MLRKYQVRELDNGREWDIVYHDDITHTIRYSPFVYGVYERAVQVADELEKANVHHPDWCLSYKD